MTIRNAKEFMMKIKNRTKIKEEDYKFFVKTHGIIFGILSGTGLVVLMRGLTSIISQILQLSQITSFIIYSALFLSLLMFTVIIYTYGWFRRIYLSSALIFYITSVYVTLRGIN